MRMSHYIDLAYKLKELMENDERFILLNKLESEMEANEEVMALSYNKDLKETYLSDTLKHFPRDSQEVKHAHLELFRASERLDAHPLVKEYLKAYKEVEAVLNQINNILFSDLKKKNENSCR